MRKLTINTISIGLVLMCVYIFLCYNATDLIIPSSMNSLSLVLFVAFGVFAFVLSAKHVKVTIPVYSVWYAAFMLASLVGMIYSTEKRLLSGEYYLMIVSFVITFFFQFFIRTEKAFSMLCWSHAIASAVLVLTLIFTDNMIADSSNRLGGELMGNANTFACMIMIAVMYMLWLLVYEEHGLIMKLLLFLLIILDYYALTLSAGRKFFVLPFIFLYILLWFKTDKTGRRHIVKYTFWILALGMVAAYLIMTVPLFYETIGYRMESLIMGMLGIREHGSSAAIRELMREIALEKWLDSPLWGHGFDSFKYYCVTVTGYLFYSHCNYTELLYNGGILYFFIYYWLFWRIIEEALLLKTGLMKYRAFAVGVMISFLVFDYGAVSYSIATIQIMYAMALRGLHMGINAENAAPELNGE